MKNKRKGTTFAGLSGAILALIMLLSAVPLQAAATSISVPQSMRNYFRTDYDLSLHLTAPDGSNRYWYDGSAGISFENSQLWLSFNDDSDEYFNDVILLVTADNSQVTVTKSKVNTDSPDPTHLTLSFSTEKTVTVSDGQTSQQYTGKEFDIILWDDVRTGAQKKTVSISDSRRPSLTLEASPSSMKSGEATQVIAHVKNSDGTTPAGVMVYFGSSGVTGDFATYPSVAYTDSFGNAYIKWTAKGSGTATIGASATIEGIYKGATATVYIQPEKPIPACDINAKLAVGDSNIYSYQDKSFKVTNTYADSVQARFTVNGEDTGMLSVKNPSYLLPDNSKFTLIDITYPYLVGQAENEEGNVGEQILLQKVAFTTFCIDVSPSTDKLPDLVVSNIAVSPVSPAENQEFYVTAEIKNLGTGFASTNFYVIIYELLGQTATTVQTSAGEQAAKMPYQAELAPGAVLYRTFGPLKLSAGTHQLGVEADTGAAVKESNENNNKAYKTVVVTTGTSTTQDVYLNQRFTLQEAGSARVVDYKKMKVIVNDIRTVYCVTTPCYPIVNVGVEMPGQEGSTGIGTAFDMSYGETRSVFDIQITLLDVSSTHATFIVRKAGTPVTPGDLKLEISPKRLQVMPGKIAVYAIAVNDKRSQGKCAGIFEEGGKKSDIYCPREQLTYTLQAQGLPFKVSLPSQISLYPGESKTVQMYVYTDMKDNTLPLVQEDAESEEIEEEDRVSEYDASGKRLVLDKYVFKVIASQAGKILDKRTGLLYLVSSEQTPPDFPEGKLVEIKLHKGWNLVSIPGELVRFEKIDSSKKLYGYVWLSERKEYVTMQQAKEILGTRFSTYLAEHAFWIYSYESQSLVVRINPFERVPISLEPGWNLVPTRYEFVGNTLAEIKNGCDLTSSYKWNAGSQEWVSITSTYQFTGNDIGVGFISKSKNYCSFLLSGIVTIPTDTDILQPPAYPTEVTPTQDETYYCKDGTTAKVIEEGAVNSYNYHYWENLGLDTSRHPEIKKYKIRWFDGSWSPWYKPGQDDVDWKTNGDGSSRRVWSYFDDHYHKYLLCPGEIAIQPSSAGLVAGSSGGGSTAPIAGMAKVEISQAGEVPQVQQAVSVKLKKITKIAEWDDDD